MLLLNKIRNDETLKEFVDDTCCEEGICAKFDAKIDKNDYIIIKVDKFYKSKRLSNTPKAIDCLIILKCQDKTETYALYLIELKRQKGKDLDPNGIPDKFRNVEKFVIESDVKKYLNRHFEKIELFLVSKMSMRDLGLESKLFMNEKIEFRGQKKRIMPKSANETIIYPYYSK